MTRTPKNIPAQEEPLAFRPLYRQVRDTLVRRIITGTWQSGQMLPSEPRLAAELHVSQGTVRKALDEMTRESLLIRRQGLGTFVADQSNERNSFNFFPIAPDEGSRVYPTSDILSSGVFRANPDERRKLQLSPNDKVARIRRVRTLSNRRVIVERLVLPDSTFPEILKLPLTGKMYGLYSSKFGVIVDRVQEQLKAVAASAADARILEVQAGTPLLLIDRLAVSLENTPIEWRLSLCLTDDFHYQAHLK